MKKLIIVALILALLLPASSLAITGDSPYFGTWVGQKHGSTANYSAIIYYLHISQYTTCDYIEIDIHHGGVLTQGKISDFKVYSGNYEIVDSHIKVPTSGISYIEVYYDEDTDTLYMDKWPNIKFARLP